MITQTDVIAGAAVTGLVLLSVVFWIILRYGK